MSVRGLFAGAGSQPTGGASYRYWRIYVQTNNGSTTTTGYAEIELRGTLGGADLTTGSTPVTESSFFSTSFYGIYSVDGSTGTYWLSASGQLTNQWCRYDLGTAQTVAQVAIYPQSAAADRSPKDFIVQGSNDGTNFTDVKAFTNVTGWTAAWKTFDL